MDEWDCCSDSSLCVCRVDSHWTNNTIADTPAFFLLFSLLFTLFDFVLLLSAFTPSLAHRLRGRWRGWRKRGHHRRQPSVGANWQIALARCVNTPSSSSGKSGGSSSSNWLHLLFIMSNRMQMNFSRFPSFTRLLVLFFSSFYFRLRSLLLCRNKLRGKEHWVY